MGLPRLIEALLDPSSYPEPPARVELRQTHISYLFFTPRFVYKIKKPVDFGFLDFSTLEKRRFFCAEEVRLNRRLAPDVYIGVVPVTEKDGKALMEGAGESIEYAVKMKRLDAGKSLENALEHGGVTTDIIERVARRVARFHAEAQTSPYISSFGSVECIRKNIGENFDQTAPFVGTAISSPLFDRIKGYNDGFMRVNEGLLRGRVEEGFVRDCHGDIHCDHVSISDGIEIIDCIEFNERFRYSDIVADAAFLSMDLDFRNRADLSRAFDAAYFASSGDAEGKGLLDFYKCYRAYVRGKVAAFKSAEEEVGPEARMAALIDAKRHFHIAGEYAEGGLKPLLIVIRGLSGTGKSMVANLLAENTGFCTFSSDLIRKELAGLAPSERRVAAYGAGIYSKEFTDKTYTTLIERAGNLLKAGRSVICDATFSKGGYLRMAKEAAREAGASFRLIECAADDETIRKRLLKRLEEPGAISDAGLEVYERQKESYEPVEGPCLEVDTTVPLNEVLVKIIDGILG